LRGDDRQIWENALAKLIPGDKPLRILDAGAGTGFLSVILSMMGHEVIGVDISPVMVQCAYETAALFGQRIEFQEMDCESLDFPDDSFDAVICLELLSTLEDDRPAVNEFIRVLKDDAHLIVIDGGDLAIGKFIARGFTHCRVFNLDELASISKNESLAALTARKPARGEDGDLPQALLFNRYQQTAKKQALLYQNWCKARDFAYQDFTVLNFVSRHVSGARPSDISTALVIPPQTLTRVLSSLEAQDLIRREVSSRDRRSSVITLSDAGARKTASLQAELRVIEEKALSAFSVEELADLSAVSDRVLKALGNAFGES